MLLRQLQYLVALADERHFARAAASCSVTQPTLSAGIKQLEEEVGVLLVLRGQRFEGFTPEGKRVLEWARRIVKEFDALRQETSRMRGELHGEIRIGAVPTAVALLPGLINDFARAHPRVVISLLSIPSDEIQRRLDDHSLDAGVTYLEHGMEGSPRAVPLLRERYVLVLNAEDDWAKTHDDSRAAAWTEVPDRPYCLLTRNMQNRRIIDEQLLRAGLNVRATAETDSITTLVALIGSGDWASIVPESLLSLLPRERIDRLATVPLADPGTASLGLLVSAQEPLTPAAQTLMESVRSRHRSPRPI